MSCHFYQPDHNGECLNCDGWADEHEWLRLDNEVATDIEEQVVHQMMRVLSGELRLHIAASMIDLMPSELLRIFAFVRPTLWQWCEIGLALGPRGEVGFWSRKLPACQATMDPLTVSDGG